MPLCNEAQVYVPHRPTCSSPLPASRLQSIGAPRRLRSFAKLTRLHQRTMEKCVLLVLQCSATNPKKLKYSVRIYS